MAERTGRQALMCYVLFLFMDIWEEKGERVVLMDGVQKEQIQRDREEEIPPDVLF